MYSRYHKWLGKESRKCAPGKATTLSLSEKVVAEVRGPQVLRPCARPLTHYPLPGERVVKLL
jgi:hypothetical protein